MYINILFMVIVLVVIIMIAKQKELTTAIKGFVITLLVLTIGMAALFEYSTSKSDENSRPLISAFKQDATLLCNDFNISLKTYSYEPGTSSFQPRINVVGETYDVKECTLK